MKEAPIKSTSRKAMRYRGIACLNCGHPLDLSDRYCAYCGQLNTTKRLTLKDFISEFILSVFTYDSKFWHTLKDLLFKPGTITRYYVDGKRFYYANPFRFFLSASIFYFIVISAFSFFQNDSFEGASVALLDNNQPLQEEQIEAIFQDSIIQNLQGVPKEFNKTISASLQKAKEEALADNRKKLRQDSILLATGLSYVHIAEKDVDTLHRIDRILRKLELF